MHKKVPTVAVLGHKASGKTTVIEKIVRELANNGLKVATAKHITVKGFSIDTEGKNTWRHSAAGANPVVSVSDVETAILIKNGTPSFSLDLLFEIIREVDVVFLEGFSSLVLRDEHVAKIFCVDNLQEYNYYLDHVKGKVLAICSHQPFNEHILKIPEDSSVYVNEAIKYVEKQIKFKKILSGLPGLDCAKCRYTTCEELADAILAEEGSFMDCLPLKIKQKLKTKITVNTVDVPIQPFVSEFVRKSLLGMISSLKGVSVNGEEEIHIVVSS